jgi:putative membrane protein
MAGKMTIKEAFMASPGPDSPKSGALLWAKGFCMGGADIIPGVSGGTIAFITGIYTQLVDAIRSFDVSFARKLFSLDISGALASVHLRFLACLLFGILTAVVSMARVMHYMLNTHPIEIWSVFFGLIAASIYVVGREIKPMNAVNAGFVMLGAIGSFMLVGMIPVTTPETLPFIFLCGAIAICAMILPGISGAFLLLMLGKYEYITGTLKNPFVADNLLIIGVFAAGACAGIVVFSRVLHYLLHRWQAPTVAVLTGFMLGALRKVWPWKEVLESTTIRGKVHVLREQNVLPNLDVDLFFAIALAVAGVIVVLLLDKMSHSKS